MNNNSTNNNSMNNRASTWNDNYHLEQLIKQYHSDNTFQYFTKMTAYIYSVSTYSLKFALGTTELEFIYPDKTLRAVERINKLREEYIQKNYSELFPNTIS